ncbi:MAG: Flp pilus assembly complex ATPase component TadA [Lachnospiraceae bacterium]|nr:Flp pilus assembly complex ATPase component TadA [Lachnospiraceae bacterium]
MAFTGFVKERKRIGDMLIDAGKVTLDQLKEALARQKQVGGRIGNTLIDMGFVTENDIVQTLCNQLKLDSVNLDAVAINKDVIALCKDSAVLKKYVVIPYEIDAYDSKYLKLAMADPMDIQAIDDMTFITGMQITPVVAATTRIMAAIDRYYGNMETQAVADIFAKERGLNNAQEEEEEVNEAVENAPIVQLVKKIIEQGARQRASDIHIEALETRIRVRYRIDGVMQEAGSYQPNMLPAMITRIKIIGGMDISEKRKPQDGRITQVVDKVEYDIRASILPTVYGEKTVMRLTAKQNLTRDKKNLGFSDEELKTFDKIFKNPNGIILVTGPTGSGKSTTLYTALAELNQTDVNIITVEDPVEANIDGINQVQVNPKADLTFASALRSILRQDPDIIMIGEIRDQETASIAVTASITGHLVVSTLHTNSAAATITRLADMGLEPYLIADSTVGVIAQRLVRRLCSCKMEDVPTEDEMAQLGMTPETIAKDKEEYEKLDPEEQAKRPLPGHICRAKGCVQCNGTGYKGRIGVYEMMSITPKLRHIISNKGTTEQIEEVAIAEGMSKLKNSAARLARQGITTIDEMKRIVYSEE